MAHFLGDGGWCCQICATEQEINARLAEEEKETQLEIEKENTQTQTETETEAKQGIFVFPSLLHQQTTH